MIYGLTDKGFVKKPYEVVVEELEQRYIEIFGNTINLEPQSPQGQLIAITAEAIYDTWEMAESVYASFNIDNVNSKLLDDRARLKDIYRYENESDEELKIRIKEQLPNDVLKLRDELEENLQLIDGVKEVFVKYEKGATSAFVLGGDEKKIAETILDYMPYGLMRGNVSVDIYGRCKNVRFYRPAFVPVKIDMQIEYFSHLECECGIANIEKMKKSIIDSSCGLGYAEYLYEDYIKNIILGNFMGVRVVDVKLYRGDIKNDIECIEFDYMLDSKEIIDVKEWERVLVCMENIFISLVQK